MKQTLCNRLVKFGRRNMVSKWLAVSLLWLGSIFSRMPGLIAGAIHAAGRWIRAFPGRAAPILRAGFAGLTARLIRLAQILPAKLSGRHDQLVRLLQMPRAKLSGLRGRLAGLVQSGMSALHTLPAIPGRAWRSVRNGLREMRARPLRRIAAIALGLCTACGMFPMEAFAANPATDGYPEYPKVESSGSSSQNWYDKITYDDFLITSYNNNNLNSSTISAFTGTVSVKSGSNASTGSHTIPAKVQFKPDSAKYSPGLSPQPSGNTNYYVYTVDTIKNGAFKFTGSQYFHITLPNTIKSIETDAFYGVGSVDVSAVPISALESAGASAFGKTIVYVGSDEQAAAIKDSALAAKSGDSSGYRGRVVKKGTITSFDKTNTAETARIVQIGEALNSAQRGFTLQYNSGDWQNTLADGTSYAVYLNEALVPLLGDGVETYVHISGTTCAVKAETDVTAGAKVTVTVRNCGSTPLGAYNLSIAGTPVAGGTSALFVGTPEPNTKHDVVVRLDKSSKLYQLTFEDNNALYIGSDSDNLTKNIGKENSAKANDQIHAITGRYFIASTGTTINDGAVGTSASLDAGDTASLSITLNKTSGGASETDVTLDKESLELKVGESAYLNVTENTSGEPLTWKSKNEEIAEVVYDPSSLTKREIEAKAAGETTIELIGDTSHKVLASCKVVVTDGSGGGSGEPGGDTADLLAEAKAKAEAALTDFTATKDTTAKDVLDAVNSAVNNENISIGWNGDPQIVAPTESTQGLISGTIVITTGGQSVEVTVHITIDSTPTVDETKAITVTVVNKTDNTATSASDDTLQKAVEAALVSKGAGGYPGNDKDVKKLLVAAGSITKADWNYISGMENMTEFSVNTKVQQVADMPDTDNGSLFQTTLVSISVPQKIKIGARAFQYCTALKTVSIPNATSVGDHAFDGCNVLAEANFPYLTAIGIQGFRYCKVIKNINFPNVAKISDSAFESCIALKSAVLPQAASIGDGAFTDCSVLANLSLPATPPTVTNANAFQNGAASRTLTIVDANGTELAGEVLATAQAAYLAAADGSTSDNLWYGWKVTDAVVPPSTGTIVVKLNDGNNVGGDTLQAAITASGVQLTSLTSLEIVSGTFTTDDWKYLASLTAMTHFTIDEAVTTVAAMPDGTYDVPVFPKTIQTISAAKVANVGAYAFKSCQALTSASFPEATAISIAAFYGCDALETADFPKVTSVKASAFNSCKALTKIDFPLATEVIQQAFQNCEKLTTVNLPLVTRATQMVFDGCTVLTDVTLPKATEVEKKAFSGCTALESISLPAATTINYDSFDGCSKLAGISLPAASPYVATVAGGNQPFDGCPAERALTIVDTNGTALSGEALTSAVADYKKLGYSEEEHTWYGWTIVGDAVVPPSTGTIVVKLNDGNNVGGDTLQAAITASGVQLANLTSLEIVSGAFTDADWKYLASLTAMTGFTIDEAVTTVAAMPDGTSSTSVFPASIQTVTAAKAANVGAYAFKSCQALTSASFLEATSVGNSAFNGCKALTTVSFPEATSVGANVFYGCQKLTSVELPKATTIQDYAFTDCSTMTKVVLPEATSIGQHAFQFCSLLKEIELPKVTTVGNYALEYCRALEKIELPKVTTVRMEAFGDCSKLAEISLPATPPTVTNEDVFQNGPSSRTLTIVDENGTALTDSALASAVAAYKAVNDGKTSDNLWYGWTLPASEEPPPSTGTIVVKLNNAANNVGGDTLAKAIEASKIELTSITSLEVVSGKFTEADWNYLASLTAMTSFTIDEAVTSVADIPDGYGEYFNHSVFPSAIVTVRIPQAVSIGNYAFYGLNTLTSVDLPAATSIGEHAFFNCKKLVTASIPKAQTLGGFAFQSCEKLEYVNFPLVETISQYAFDGCSGLTNANFPKVTTIKDHAFFNCNNLSAIILPATPPTVGDVAFHRSANTDGKRTLTIADVTGEELAAAVAAYKTVDDGSAGDAGDGAGTNLWYGWTIYDSAPPTPGTHTVTGTVKDQDGNPVNDATVTLTPASPATGGSKETQTNTSGEYTFTDVPEGEYRIEVTFPGGGTATGTITVGSDGTITGGTDITKPADPVSGGGLSSPLTQDKVDEVFGEGNATLNENDTITINKDVILTGPVDVGTSVTIDLNGHNITGANGADNSSSPASDGQPAFRVTADNVTLTFTNSASTGGVIRGGDGGNGGVQYPDGGAGAPAVSQGDQSNCEIEVGTNVQLQGGKGGDAYSSGSGDGGNGGEGSSTGTGDTTINSGGSATGGEGGNGSGDGSGGNGGNGSSTDSGKITVDDGGSATGGSGGEGSGSGDGGKGGNGTDTSTGGTTVDGGATGGSGGDASDPEGSGNGGNGGNGSSANPGGTVDGSGTVTGGNGGDAAGSGDGGEGGKGLPDGVKPGDGLDVVDGVKGHAIVVIDDSKAGTTVTVPDESKVIDAVLTEEEKNDPTIKVVLSVEKQDSPVSADKTAVEAELQKISANTIGVYFDISLQKIAGSSTTDISETTSGIEIRITIPTGMRGGSNYAVIRVHGDKGEALATRQEGDVLIFSSDKFSTYAIAYTPKVTPPPVTPPSGNHSSSGNTYFNYKITATAGEGGAISPNGEVYVRELDDQTFTVKAADGYRVDKLLIDDREAALKDGTYIFEEVLEDHAIRVSFIKAESETPENGAQTKPNQTSNPSTGDNTDLVWLFVFLSVLAGMNLCAIMLLRKNRTAKNMVSAKRIN